MSTAPIPPSEPADQTSASASPKRMNYITPDEEAQIARLAREGMSAWNISKSIGRSASGVDRVLKRLKLARNKNQWTRTRKDINPKQIKTYLREGKTQGQIARLLGVSMAPIRRVIEENPQLQKYVVDYRRSEARRSSGDGKRSHLSRAGIEAIKQAQRERWRRAHAAQAERVARENAQPGVIPTAQIRPNRKGLYVCPECHEEFEKVRYLGRHRTKHGVLGTSVAAQQRAQHKARMEEEAPSETQASRKDITNGQPVHAHEDGLDKHIIFLFAGFQKEIQIYGDEHEIPWKVLASGVAELFQLTTRRRSLGLVRQMPALRGITS